MTVGSAEVVLLKNRNGHLDSDYMKGLIAIREDPEKNKKSLDIVIKHDIIPNMIERFELMDFWTDEERESLQTAREKKGCCEQCGSVDGVKWCMSATAYYWDQYKELESPNRKMFFCERCTEEYYAYWDEMWSNVPGHGG